MTAATVAVNSATGSQRSEWATQALRARVTARVRQVERDRAAERCQVLENSMRELNEAIDAAATDVARASGGT